MRTFMKLLRTLSAVTLFFFCWTFMPLYAAVAYAATAQGQGSGVKGQGATPLTSPLGKGGERGVGERFEKAIDEIRENVHKAEKRHEKGEDDKAERELIRSKRAEVDSLDVELRKEFAATEKKLKDAKLPKEILDRHYKFVKHYDDNFKELKANLDAVDKHTVNSIQGKEALRKAKEHLERTKAPSKHVPLDPNNLPFRTVKGKERAPRLKKEEFEKEFGPQKRQAARTASATDGHGWTRIIDSATRRYTSRFTSPASHLQVAYNASNASDMPLDLPRPEDKVSSSEFPLSSVGKGAGVRVGERTEVRGGINGDEGRFTLPDFAFSGHLSAMSYDLQAVVLAQATTDLPTAADLAETPEVQFTQDIRDLAAQLDNKPTKIFEWVKNNIEFVPSYGSIQGADMCLQSRQCNAMDTASLLIALLRSSNRPARYVYGTIEVPMDKVMNWVGGFTDARAAISFMASGGIPVAGKMSGGTITAVLMEHAWVETYIPYGNYRGAIMDDSLKTWIPLDGSFKQYAYTSGFDITGAVPFSQDEYLSQVQSQNAIHYYQGKIQEYLDANRPDTYIVDVKGYREIPQETYHFLPSTLSYKPVTVLGSFTAAPANMTASVTFMLSDAASGSSAAYTASTSELAGKRITVSYIPATTTDEELIASYGGFLYDVPAYMLNLKPVLRIEGVARLTGASTNLGNEQSMSMQFVQPSGNNESVHKRLIAGAYYAVGMSLQGVNENVLGKRNYQLNKNIISETAGTLGNDDLIGEHLFILATTYHFANDKVYKSGAKLYNMAMMRTLTEGITSFALSVSHLFSVPRSAMPSGVNMDVAMDRIIVVAKDNNTQKEKAYMDIAGLVSSYHEHDVFERIDEFAAVSAVRALQVASANAIPLQKVTAANIGQLLPALQVSADIKVDIQNAVNAGKEVTMPRMNVQINDWNGVGYIIKDPQTGSGTYMITGGLAGSDGVLSIGV